MSSGGLWGVGFLWSSAFCNITLEKVFNDHQFVRKRGAGGVQRYSFGVTGFWLGFPAEVVRDGGVRVGSFCSTSEPSAKKCRPNCRCKIGKEVPPHKRWGCDMKKNKRKSKMLPCLDFR